VSNINDAFPSNYLKASDLQGSQPVVTIDRVGFEPVGRDKEMKPIVYFAGKDKGLVLNKTNAKNIAHLVGSFETNDWSGFRIKLYSANVEFQGETVESIRVKAAPPANGNAPMPVAPPPPPSAGLDDSDIPFAWLMPLVLPALGIMSLGVLA
jgi:hypothetical protein